MWILTCLMLELIEEFESEYNYCIEAYIFVSVNSCKPMIFSLRSNVCYTKICELVDFITWYLPWSMISSAFIRNCGDGIFEPDLPLSSSIEFRISGLIMILRITKVSGDLKVLYCLHYGIIFMILLPFPYSIRN